jgi:hypothetical protein
MTLQLNGVNSRLLIVDRKGGNAQMQFKQANKLNSNSTLSEKTENKTNPLTSRYSSNAATKATTTDSLAKESKSLGKIELCCMKAKKMF